MKPEDIIPESKVPPAVDLAIATGAPQIYANGFTLGMSNADTFLVLQRFGKPVAVVNLSYTLAKTLAQKLGTLVAYWETKTEQPIQTTDDLDKAFKKGANGPIRDDSINPDNK